MTLYILPVALCTFPGLPSVSIVVFLMPTKWGQRVWRWPGKDSEAQIFQNEHPSLGARFHKSKSWEVAGPTKHKGGEGGGISLYYMELYCLYHLVKLISLKSSQSHESQKGINILYYLICTLSYLFQSYQSSEPSKRPKPWEQAWVLVVVASRGVLNH